MTDDFDLICGSEFDGTRGQKWEVIDFVLKASVLSPLTL